MFDKFEEGSPSSMDPRKKLERGNPDLVAGHAKKGSGLRRLADL